MDKGEIKKDNMWAQLISRLSANYTSYMSTVNEATIRSVDISIFAWQLHLATNLHEICNKIPFHLISVFKFFSFASPICNILRKLKSVISIECTS